VECPYAVKDQSISSQARRDATGGVRIAAHLEDAFGVPILLHEMTPALALGMGTPLQSRKGLERLTVQLGNIGELARWLSSDQAKSLEQEELESQGLV